MEELIKLLEKEQDVFESKYALEEAGFEQGLQKAIDIVKLFAIPDVSESISPAEYSEKCKKEGKIDWTDRAISGY